ncbi:histidine kinase [Rhizoctonia solani AG-1 IA]|uniref:Histidine kinase n=1 Tax=Thanatephorus cucumeris (strain AG1-IA) TaxID=983506 RepID=L8WKG7_THACA|nr:histidine kinase [Rhizoctonia solani AG-1 IA]
MWGWPDLVILYNDTYARMIGPKHPGIYGQPAKLWGEIWDSIGPAADIVRSGKAICKTDVRAPTAVPSSWHWTPIWQDDGSIDGIWNTTWETTTKVIAERRLSCMSELFSRLADTRTQEKFGEGTLEVLARNPCDLPFIALYWCRAENPPSPDDKSKAASLALKYLRHQTSSLIQVKLTLAGSIGIPSNHPMARETIEYTLDPVTYHIVRERSDSASTVSSPLPTGSTGPTSRPKMLSPPNSSTSSVRSIGGLDMTNSLVSGSIEIVDPLPSHLARGLDGRGFGDIPRTAAILPILVSSSTLSLPHAILVVGLNTRREYDADYASWLESLSAGISNQLSVVLQREADMRMMIERERMDKAKTMFFTNVSHGMGFGVVVELRTPLTLIQAPLDQLLASRGLDGSAQYKLQLAARNCKRLNKLIDSIMDMSKLEAGRLAGKFRPVQLGRLTADIAALFRSLAEKKGIEFKIEIAELEVEVRMLNGCPRFVGKDRVQFVCREPHGRVRMTLLILGGVGGGGWNRLSNAFKYTTRGVVTVSVVHELNESHVQVRDTGVGIPKDYLNQVFDRFFRVHNNVSCNGGSDFYTSSLIAVGRRLPKALVSDSRLSRSVLFILQTTGTNPHHFTGARLFARRSNSPGIPDRGRKRRQLGECIHRDPSARQLPPSCFPHPRNAIIIRCSRDAAQGDGLVRIIRFRSFDSTVFQRWTEFEQPVPSSAGSASDEGESATSSTLFFEKEDVILIVDDVSPFPLCISCRCSTRKLEERGHAAICTQDI